MLFTHIVWSNLLAIYAKNVFNKINTELTTNIVLTFLIWVIIKYDIDIILMPNEIPNTIDNA